MKFFVLLHNQIMMSQAAIYNSTEDWRGVEVEEVVFQLKWTVGNYHLNGYLTDYQRDHLIKLIEGIVTF